MSRTIPGFGYILSISLLIISIVSGCKKADSSPAPTASATTTISPPSSLHVPFIPQRADEWCWAACTEMVSSYYHRINPNAPAITQCELLNSIYGANMKCPVLIGSVPDSFDMPGTPFPPLGNTNTCQGYTMTQTMGATIPGDPSAIAELPWDSLKSVIASGSPVIFEWGWEGITIATIDSNDTHFMVAEGIPHTSQTSERWISVNDPWPPGVGKHRIMTYNEYANHVPTSSPGSKTIVFNAHGTDYYNFTWQGK